MSDVTLKPSTQSWHARRFFATEGKVGKTNLCYYFWVVVKSLAMSLISTKTVKSMSRTLMKIGFWAISAVIVLAASIFAIGFALMLLTLLGSWLLAFIAWATGSEIAPQNTIPFLVLLRGDNTANPLTHSDALFFVYMSVAIDFLIVLGLSVWGVAKYNATHTAGFIRLSWERFKVWKDGTVVCPIIEFEESQ